MTLSAGGTRSLAGVTMTLEGTANWMGTGTISATQGTVSSRVNVLPGGALNIQPSATASLNRASGTGMRDALDVAGLLSVDHATLTGNASWLARIW